MACLRQYSTNLSIFPNCRLPDLYHAFPKPHSCLIDLTLSDYHYRGLKLIHVSKNRSLVIVSCLPTKISSKFTANKIILGCSFYTKTSRGKTPHFAFAIHDAWIRLWCFCFVVYLFAQCCLSLRCINCLCSLWAHTLITWGPWYASSQFTDLISPKHCA